jgi:nitroreductase
VTGAASFEQLVRTRRSVRDFDSRPVPVELVTRAIELATWAPNGGNRQVWHFYFVQDRPTIEKMAAAVRSRTELMLSWPEAASLGDTGQQWLITSDLFKRAPACIAVTIGRYQTITDRLAEQRLPFDLASQEITQSRQRAASEVQSVGAAIGYLLLGLHEVGLGGCYMTGPLQAATDIEAILEVPEGWRLAALIPIGYPANPLRSGIRKPVTDVMTIV